MSYTEYVEMIVLLHQQNPDDTIKIDLALGELDVTSAELKATHQEIKDYVLKKLVHIGRKVFIHKELFDEELKKSAKFQLTL